MMAVCFMDENNSHHPSLVNNFPEYPCSWPVVCSGHKQLNFDEVQLFFPYAYASDATSENTAKRKVANLPLYFLLLNSSIV